MMYDNLGRTIQVEQSVLNRSIYTAYDDIELKRERTAQYMALQFCLHGVSVLLWSFTFSSPPSLRPCLIHRLRHFLAEGHALGGGCFFRRSGRHLGCNASRLGPNRRVAFFRFAEDAFIAADIAFLNSASSGGAMMAASASNLFGARGPALAALIAAQRLFCPSAILRRVAALNPFFLGAGVTFALGLTQSGMVGSS
jgi:hypothetical protein